MSKAVTAVSKVTFADTWGLGVCNPSLAVCNQHMSCLHGKTQGMINQRCFGLIRLLWFFSCYLSNSCRHFDLVVLCCSTGAVKGDLKILTPLSQVVLCCPATSIQLRPRKRGWLTSLLRASRCWRCISQRWPGHESLQHGHCLQLSISWPCYFWVQ